MSYQHENGACTDGSPLEPLFRRSTKHAAVSEADQKESQFSIVSYNILADLHIPEHKDDVLYPFCLSEFKYKISGAASYRHKLLIKELQWLNGDILCLQEVDTWYFPILQECLESFGYEGIFAEKTMNVKEGLALFYKKGLFQLERSTRIVLHDLIADACDKVGCTELGSYFQQPHVVQLASLKHLNSSHVLTVGNIHTVWGEWFTTVTQALQVAVATQALDSFSSHSNIEEKNTSKIVFCGDFNLEPGFPAYEMLRYGQLSDQGHSRLKGVDYIRWDPTTTSPLEKLPAQEITALDKLKKHLVHSLETLKSGYHSVMGKEPAFTSFTGTTPYTLDYIWYTENSLKVTSVVNVPNVDLITQEGGIPCQFFPSDHLSLKAFFQFV